MTAATAQTPTKLQGSVSRIFIRYTLPSVAALLVSGLYEIIDGIFIGRYIGSEGLISINMAWPLVFTLTGLGILVGIGCGALMSISIGRNDQQEAQQVLSSSLLFVLLLSVLSGILMLWGSEFLIRLQGASDIVVSMSLDYTHVFAWGSIITIAAITLPILVRNDHSPVTATLMLATGALMNILLDYLFIARFGWGMRGAGLATILAQLSVCLIGCYYFISDKAEIKPCFRQLKIKPQRLWQIASLGVSPFILYFYTSFDVALHNWLFMEYGSDLHVAAFAIVGYLMMLYYLIAEGIVDGMQPPMSFFYGANKMAKGRSLLKLTGTVVILFGISWVALLWLWPQQVTGFFADGNPALLEEAGRGLYLHLFALYLDGFIVLASVYFVSLNQSGKALVISLGNILIQLPFLLILPHYLGPDGIWIAVPLSNITLTLIVAPMLWRAVKSTHQTATQPSRSLS